MADGFRDCFLSLSSVFDSNVASVFFDRFLVFSVDATLTWGRSGWISVSGSGEVGGDAEGREMLFDCKKTSKYVERATAAHTHTTGVNVNIKRTITLAKYDAVTAYKITNTCSSRNFLKQK